MGSDKNLSLSSLERPERVQDILRQDRVEDCLSCKVIGSGALFGLAGYSYFSGMAQLERQRNAIMQSKSMFGMGSRRFGIAGISFGLFVMGMWRAFK